MSIGEGIHVSVESDADGNVRSRTQQAARPQP